MEKDRESDLVRLTPHDTVRDISTEENSQGAVAVRQIRGGCDDYIVRDVGGRI